MGGNFTEGHVILSPGTQQEDTRGMLRAPRLKTFNKQSGKCQDTGVCLALRAAQTIPLCDLALHCLCNGIV